MILNSLTALAEEGITELAETVSESGEAIQLLEETKSAAGTNPFLVPSGPMLIVVVIALIISVIVVSSFINQMKTAAKKTGAREYAKKDTFRLDRQSDYFLYESVQRRPIQTNNPPKQGGNGPVNK